MFLKLLELRFMFLRSVAFWILSFLWMVSGSLEAQFMTNIQLNKKNLLTYEGVEATVTISNRSGGDVVMRGPNGMSWLTFDITNPRGHAMPPMQVHVEENLLLKSGATISRKVLLSSSYSFGEPGNYRIGASVFHPGSSQYFASNKVIVNVNDARPFWEQNVGVPTGKPNAGKVRKFSLSVVRETQQASLYLRLQEERTGLNVITFSLGNVIMLMSPQVSVDLDNQLHAFFMTSPKIYAHVIVDAEGKIVSRTLYRETEASRPQLVTQPNQGFTIQGGDIYDPSATQSAPRKQGRSIGVRPPGL